MCVSRLSPPAAHLSTLDATGGVKRLTIWPHVDPGRGLRNPDPGRGLRNSLCGRKSYGGVGACLGVASVISDKN